MAVPGVPADVGTSYMVNASKLHQQQQLSKALQSPVVIEQAKGIMACRRSVTIGQADA